MPDKLKERFLTSIPDKEIIPLFTDKERFADLNSRLEIPAPAAAAPATQLDEVTIV